MSVITTFTLRHMWLKRKRTMVTMIGVILSVAAFTGVAAIGASAENLMYRQAIYSKGNWHIQYDQITAQTLSKLKQQPDIDQVLVSKDLGYAYLPGGKNVDKPYVFLQAYNPTALQDYPIHLVSGRLPENENELVISSHIMTNGKARWQVGDWVSLKIGQRVVKNNMDQKIVLDQDSYYLNTRKENKGEVEELQTDFEKNYQIVGVMERMDLEPYSAPGYTIVTYYDTNTMAADAIVCAGIHYSNGNIEQNGQEMAKFLYGTSDIDLNSVNYNESLIELETNEIASVNIKFKQELVWAQSFFNLLIMVGAITFISNTFAISLADRCRDIGILASVGATKRQQRNSVFLEACVIGCISIPIGLLLGYLGVRVTFQFLDPLVQYVYNMQVPLVAVFSLRAAVEAVLITAATLLLSAWFPARKASRIYPIEVMRQLDQIQLTSKDVKTPGWVDHFFGFEGELALKNVKRQKFRYRTTVFSIFISIMIFMGMSSYLHLYEMNNLKQMNQVGYYDAATENLNKEEGAKAIKTVREMEGIKDCASIYEGGGEIMSVEYTSSRLTKEAEKAIQRSADYLIVPILMDQKGYEDYAKSAGITLSETEGTLSGIALNYLITNEGKQTGMVPFAFPANDRITIEGTEVEIVATTQILPMGRTYSSVDKPILYVIMPENSRILAVDSGGIYVTSSQPELVKRQLQSLSWDVVAKNVKVDHYYAATLQAIREYQVLKVLSYGYIILISAICIANIFNMISNNIALRRREIAMLRSSGMDNQSFHKMITFESLYYGGKALLYGIPVSFLVNYHLLRQMYVGWYYPWMSLGVTIIAVLVIVTATFFYSVQKIHYDSLIEELRNENL